MVRRAASPGFESWWQRPKRRVLRQPDPPARYRHVRPGASGTVPLQQPPRSRVPVLLESVCPRHLAARARRLARRTPPHAVHHRRHPQVFVTLTAPGFGPVHTTRDDTHNSHGRRCHDPGRSGYRRCPHGKPLWCSTIHGDNDARVGQPYAKTATTTPGTSCSPGTPRAGGASPSPCADCWTATSGPWVKPPPVFASTT